MPRVLCDLSTPGVRDAVRQFLRPGTIRSILNNQAPVIRSNGLLVRDYFYIEDGAAAYLMLAEKMEALHLAGEAFNFSNEHPVSVIDVVNRVLHLMGSSLQPNVLNAPEAAHEIREQYLSAKKAHRVLGWKPLFDLDAGLRKTISWYQQYFAAGRKIFGKP